MQMWPGGPGHAGLPHRARAAPAQTRQGPSHALQHGGEELAGHDTSLFSNLVLGYIETKFCNQNYQIRMLQQFSKSTKLSKWFFENFAKFAEIRKNPEKFAKFPDFCKTKFLVLAKVADFCEILKFFENLAR